MNRVSSIVCAVVLLAGTAVLATSALEPATSAIEPATPKQDQPIFKSSVRTVPIYATVVDSSGRLVPDLERADFSILDNAKPAEVSLFSNDSQPFSAVVMLVLTLLCRIAPDRMVGLFSSDPAVVAFGSEYLRIISWNFLASGLVFVTSSLFQGLGNTLPPLGSSVLRIALFAIPAYILAQRPDFQMRTVWLISVASVFLQAIVSVSLLHREFLRKLSVSGGLLSRTTAATLE